LYTKNDTLAILKVGFKRELVTFLFPFLQHR